MADVKISGLPAASSVTGAMEFEVNDAGSSKKATGNQIQDKVIGTTNGLIARTAANTVAARTITAGTGIIVSNGNGVAGNPTIGNDFATQAEAEAGTVENKAMNPLRVKQAIISVLAKAGLLPIGTALGGGFYIGNIVDGGHTYALVLAPKASGQSNSLQYGGFTNNDNADSATNGPTNTANLVADAHSHPAAEFCAGLTIDGYDDWYLPARDELTLIFDNRSHVIGANALDQDATYYWSSTESSNNLAHVRRFSDGGETTYGKGNSTRVRAVRRLAI